MNGFERVPLTPLEFGLFSHLRQCEGKAVSRSDLLREVWGTEARATGGSNVVDAVVRSLRRKLGPICTSRRDGARRDGYRLRARLARAAQLIFTAPSHRRFIEA